MDRMIPKITNRTMIRTMHIHGHEDSDNWLKSGNEETGPPLPTLGFGTAVETPDPELLAAVVGGKALLFGLKLGKAALS
jgi:hypothetical protein